MRITFRSALQYSSPGWSPDGLRLVFTGDDDEESRIYVRRLGTRTTAPLTDQVTVDRNGVWSPDGLVILFEGFRPTNGELYLAEPGLDPIEVTDDPAPDLAPDWSPDGSQIADDSQTRRHLSSRLNGRQTAAVSPSSRTEAAMGTYTLWLRTAATSCR